MEGLEMICFQIISSVGTARSSYIEAIQKAKQGSFEEARECIAAGQKEIALEGPVPEMEEEIVAVHKGFWDKT